MFSLFGSIANLHLMQKAGFLTKWLKYKKDIEKFLRLNNLLSKLKLLHYLPKHICP